MAISESVPERRNLVVLSLAIILFYAAGGNFLDNTLALQVVRIEFSNRNFLRIFVWVSLVWFAYRYWLVQQGTWREGYLNELSSDECKFIYYTHLVRRFQLSNSGAENKHSVCIDVRTQGNKLKFLHVCRDDSGKQILAYIEPTFRRDGFRLLLCHIYIFFRRPSLSTYFFPYALFITAIVFGIWNAALNF